MARGYVLFVYHLKGGVGKSTMVTNIAGAMSQLGKRVLLVDMDPQCATTYMVGAAPVGVEESIAGAMVDGIKLASSIKATRFQGIDIVPGSEDLWALDLSLEQVTEGRDTLLTKTLETIKDLYDMVIIDSHNKYGWAEINALVASNSILVPVQCGVLPFEFLGSVQRVLDRFGKTYSKPVPVLGYVVTMYRRNANLVHWHTISKETERILRERYGQLVLNQVIDYDESVAEAPRLQEPIEYYRGRGKASGEFVELTKEILGRVNGHNGGSR